MDQSSASLESTIAALEAQRPMLGDAVVDSAIRPLRVRLSALRSQQSGAAQQLKTVSVLFMDVVGSTAMADDLDPEDVHAILDGALQRLTSVVTAHGGKVLQYAGDSILAAFGADAVREDDAERAVRCGLGLLGEAKTFAASEATAHGLPDFNVRVGIHTGPVLLGGGVDDEGSIRGAAVNVAARMEQSAPSGGLRISHDTYSLVEGLFDVTEQDPIAVKGVSEPVRTYLVQRALPHAFRGPRRGVQGIESPMVGRATEFKSLTDAFERVMQKGTLGLVTVTGEAGIGKSRLIREFEQWVESRIEMTQVFHARTKTYGLSIPYGVLRDLFYWRFQIHDSDTQEVAQRKLLDGLAPVFDSGAEEPAALIGQLIGLDFRASVHLAGILGDPRVLRNRAFGAAAEFFRRLATISSGLMLVLDDLHWADEGSLDFIEHLRTNLLGVPMFVVCSTRHALFERQPGLGRMHHQDLRLDLQALPAATCGELADALLQRVASPSPALRDLIVRGAEGNPFYMEELTKMLIDQRVIVPAGGKWDVRQQLTDIRVPLTLTGVLQARLDALADRDRLTLQQSSIIGAVFWEQALAALDPAAPASLNTLGERQFVQRHERSAFDDSSEFAFSHHLLHQVTYDTVLKSVRRAAHARAAAWLAERVNERSREYLAATAEHFERAGDKVRAADYFGRAAQDAEGRFANDVAIENARRSLANLAANDVPSRFAMLRLLDRVLDVQGRRAEQRTLHDEMELLAPAGEISHSRAALLVCRALLADRLGDFTTARQRAIETIEVAEAVGAWPQAARGYGEWAYVSAHFGEHAMAREKAALALQCARKSDEVLAVAQALAIGAHVEGASQNNAKAAALTLEAIALAREHGHRRLEGLLQGNLGGILHLLGDEVGARAHQLEGLRIARELGNRSMEGNSLCTLSEIMLALGEAAKALELAHQAVAITTSLNDRHFRAMSLLALGEAQRVMGDPASASESFNLARSLFEEAAVPGATWQAAAHLSELALSRDKLDVALGHLAQLVASPADNEVLDSAPQPQRIRLTCYRVLAANGDARAASWLAAAHTALQMQAAQLNEPAMRERFLQGVAHHREILAAWHASR